MNFQKIHRQLLSGFASEIDKKFTPQIHPKFTGTPGEIHGCPGVNFVGLGWGIAGQSGTGKGADPGQVFQGVPSDPVGCLWSGPQGLEDWLD